MGGKHREFSKHHLCLLSCLDNVQSGQNVQRLTIVIAPTVWYGKLSFILYINQ
ncbi:MAG: hypothetical protein AB8V57_00695 [Coxiella endosymbiont of Dermacentor nuttalli]